MKPLHINRSASRQPPSRWRALACRGSAANLWRLKHAAFCLPRRCASTAGRKPLRILCGLSIAVVLQLGVLAGSAQTYLYTYTGNDFTSAGGPYTTSDNITANLVLSAPLGANYEGSPSTTLLNFGINDGVYQDLPSLPNMYVANFTFGTDSSGDIVSWDFAMIGFHEYLNPVQSVTMITIDQPGDVMDSTSIDTPNGNIGAGSVPSDQGVWVETVVPEPSVGTLFVSFAALVLAFVRFKPQYKSNTAVLTQSIESEKPL